METNALHDARAWCDCPVVSTLRTVPYLPRSASFFSRLGSLSIDRYGTDRAPRVSSSPDCADTTHLCQTSHLSADSTPVAVRESWPVKGQSRAYDV